MTTETYLNSPVRNCQNCVHRVRDSYFENEHWDRCRRFQLYCRNAMSSSLLCGINLREWRPTPPKSTRRSLRQFLCDILWKP